MSYMFLHAHAFHQDLFAAWNVTMVQHMEELFADARGMVDDSYNYTAWPLLEWQQGIPSIRLTNKEKKQQLVFAVEALSEALSPANFLLTNPVVMKRTVETKGQNLVRGMRHLITDLKRGQLTHTDPDAFTLGENLAATPGKVVYETNLFQLIQYSPSTEDVYEVPLVIFPPWINRFYILDLTPKKSFIKWAVDQGITVFVVSWKSADDTMGDVVWDDYILSQIEAIDHVRERLKVPHVHTIGYCVAGTTLAATLALLTRRDEAERRRSAGHRPDLHVRF